MALWQTGNSWCGSTTASVFSLQLWCYGSLATRTVVLPGPLSPSSCGAVAVWKHVVWSYRGLCHSDSDCGTVAVWQHSGFQRLCLFTSKLWRALVGYGVLWRAMAIWSYKGLCPSAGCCDPTAFCKTWCGPTKLVSFTPATHVGPQLPGFFCL